MWEYVLCQQNRTNSVENTSLRLYFILSIPVCFDMQMAASPL